MASSFTYFSLSFWFKLPNSRLDYSIRATCFLCIGFESLYFMLIHVNMDSKLVFFLSYTWANYMYMKHISLCCNIQSIWHAYKQLFLKLTFLLLLFFICVCNMLHGLTVVFMFDIMTHFIICGAFVFYKFKRWKSKLIVSLFWISGIQIKHRIDLQS